VACVFNIASSSVCLPLEEDKHKHWQY
jgi:hypothetical protein